MSSEDWLSNEKFDFVLTPSPISSASLHNETIDEDADDDEDVFFGPVTHKERCAAAIVKETEESNSPIELNPQQQAQVLKETALLTLMLKRGTPCSPVAIVRPIMRDQKNTDYQNEQTKECHSKQKTNNQTQPSTKLPLTHQLNKTKDTYQPSSGMKAIKPRRSALPTMQGTSGIRKPMKVGSRGESPVDQASLYGLDPKQVVKPRRASALPLPKDGSKIRPPAASAVARKKSALPVSRKSIVSQGTPTGQPNGRRPLTGRKLIPKSEGGSSARPTNKKPESRLNGGRALSEITQNLQNVSLVKDSSIQAKSPLGVKRLSPAVKRNSPKTPKNVAYIRSRSSVESPLARKSTCSPQIPTDIPSSAPKPLLPESPLVHVPASIRSDIARQESDILIEPDTKHQPTPVSRLPDCVATPPLLDISDSPPQRLPSFADPFKTGDTPPAPLLLDWMLQPEKPKEKDLIEF